MNTTQAKELGRTLRLIRHVRELTLRDVARQSGYSYQYVQNIESGYRGSRGIREHEAYRKLADGYGVPEAIIRTLVLRGEVLSELEELGLDGEGRMFVWRGIESRLRELGHDVRTETSEIVGALA